MNILKTLFSIGYYSAIALTAMLLIAKYTGVSEPSWLTVFSPIIIFVSIVLCVLIIGILILNWIGNAIKESKR